MPPPAPVPTMAKSTSSMSRYSRIGIQPPSRNTSGARPSPRPRRRSADHPTRSFFLERRALRRRLLPRPLPTGSRRSNPMRTYPRGLAGPPKPISFHAGGMRVISVHDVARQAAPRRTAAAACRSQAGAFQLALLHGDEQRVLSAASSRVERQAVGMARLFVHAPAARAARHRTAAAAWRCDSRRPRRERSL